MVEDTHVDEAQGGLEGLGEELVRARGFALPAGVRVAEDHAARVVVQRPLDDFAWIDAGLLQGAGCLLYTSDAADE